MGRLKNSVKNLIRKTRIKKRNTQLAALSILAHNQNTATKANEVFRGLSGIKHGNQDINDIARLHAIKYNNERIAAAAAEAQEQQNLYDMFLQPDPPGPHGAWVDEDFGEFDPNAGKKLRKSRRRRRQK